MQKFNFSYDKENDDLFLFSSKSKSKGSVEIGDFILDFNKRKELVGLEIINASILIKNIVNENTATIKDLLNSLKMCKVDVKTKNNVLIIKIYLQGDSKEISPVISMPRIIEPSPALATV